MKLKGLTHFVLFCQTDYLLVSSGCHGNGLPKNIPFFKVFLRTFVTAMGKEIIYAFMISKKSKSLSSQDDCQFIYAYAIPIAWIKL